MSASRRQAPRSVTLAISANSISALARQASSRYSRCSATYPGQAALLTGVANLVRLHTRHPALQRNEISFFYFHPQFDDNAGCRVFGYARTAGNGIGNTGQVIVLANMGTEKFPVYVIPNWPWGGRPLTEAATPGAPGPMPPPVPVYDGISNSLTLALDAFQVRVFTS